MVGITVHISIGFKKIFSNGVWMVEAQRVIMVIISIAMLLLSLLYKVYMNANVVVID